MTGRDLRSMSARDLLEALVATTTRDRWGATTIVESLSTMVLRVALAAGLTDFDALMAHRDALMDGDTGEMLRALTHDGTNPIDPPLDVADLDAISLVGVEVYRDDRVNLDEWIALAREVEQATGTEDHEGRVSWTLRGEYYWSGRKSIRALITEMLAAGRGPHYGREIVKRAIEFDVSPNTYGFSTAVTPGVFSTLAEARIGGPELDAVLAEDISLDMAVALMAHCPAGAIVAAKRLGHEPQTWHDLVTGMSARWFPLFDGHPDRPMDPIAQGMIGRIGFTWDQLRELVDLGWAADGGVAPYSVERIGYGSGRRSGGTITLSTEQAMRVARLGLRPEDLGRWATGLTASSKKDDLRREPSHFYTPLLDRIFRIDSDLDAVRKLLDVDVTTSSLNDYRFAGCRDVGDVVTAARAGITPKRVKHLRATYGETLSTYDRRKYFPGLKALLAVHTEHPEHPEHTDADAGHKTARAS